MNRPDEAEALASLRELLVGPERAERARLEGELNDPERQLNQLAGHLPAAVRRSAAQGAKLGESLSEPIEQALIQSARFRPERLAEAIFPIILPAVKRAITAQLRATFDGLNELLERSFTVHGLRWRLKAWRTGQSVAEIALLDSLVYRVEQVLLIHDQTGLLLAHAEAGVGPVRDADLVSGMLTAIQDFVRDSFSGAGEDRLDTLRVGERTVWVVRAPGLILAAAVLGVAPPPLRERLESKAYELSRAYAGPLQQFSGDNAPFADANQALQGCLEQHRLEHRPSRAPLYALALVALGIVGYFLWNRRPDPWPAFERRLRSEPGLVVIAGGARGEGYWLRGLKDPLAPDPRTLWSEGPVPPIALELEAFQSLDPRLVARRAAQILEPPSSVHLELEGRALVSTGTASHAFVVRARDRAQWIAGVERYDDRGLVDVDEQAVPAAIAALAPLRVSFAVGQVEPEDPAQIVAMKAALATLGRALERADAHQKLRLIGRADETGPDETNLDLSRRRAERVRDLLGALGPTLAVEAVAGERSSGPKERYVGFDLSGASP
ncbi:MAG: hypothetical protein U1E65_27815 [Myxococcota bacterium]